MTRFRQPEKEAVKVGTRMSKWDRCTIHSTGKEYRPQAQSGRTAVLKFVKEGMTVRQLVEAAAQEGHKADFSRGAIIKHHDSGTGAWKMEGYDGLSIEQIKKIRESSNAEVQEQRDAAKREKVEAKARAAAERTAKKEAQAAERKAKNEQKKVERQAQVSGDTSKKRVSRKSAAA